jgi:HD-GYP domain-containing protein (c-di-GMP phosphodiesterase class II)
MLHDLGEINMPSTILNKKTCLSESEYILIKQHPQIAYDILKDVGFDEKINKIICK